MAIIQRRQIITAASVIAALGLGLAGCTSAPEEKDQASEPQSSASEDFVALPTGCTYESNTEAVSCQYTTSQQIDLDSLISEINSALSSQQVSATTPIWFQAWGGIGHKGKGEDEFDHEPGGAAGPSGFSQSIQTSNSLAGAPLYAYVGENGPDNTFGASISIVMKVKLSTDPQISDVVVIGGGGGGASNACKTAGFEPYPGHDGGSGGIAISNESGPKSGPGGDGSGHHAGTGGNSNGSGNAGGGGDSHSGTAGIGGVSDVPAEKDNPPTGFVDIDNIEAAGFTPTAGAGATSTGHNQGSGGGGYGGGSGAGGFNCKNNSPGSGGGGGSYATAGTTTDDKAPTSPPDSPANGPLVQLTFSLAP